MLCWLRVSKWLGRTSRSLALEDDCQHDGGDWEEHDISDDADVPDVHVAHWDAGQADKGECRAAKEKIARKTRETYAVNCACCA